MDQRLNSCVNEEWCKLDAFNSIHPSREQRTGNEADRLFLFDFKGQLNRNRRIRGRSCISISKTSSASSNKNNPRIRLKSVTSCLEPSRQEFTKGMLILWLFKVRPPSSSYHLLLLMLITRVVGKFNYFLSPRECLRNFYLARKINWDIYDDLISLLLVSVGRGFSLISFLHHQTFSSSFQIQTVSDAVFKFLFFSKHSQHNLVSIECDSVRVEWAAVHYQSMIRIYIMFALSFHFSQTHVRGRRDRIKLNNNIAWQCKEWLLLWKEEKEAGN